MSNKQTILYIIGMMGILVSRFGVSFDSLLVVPFDQVVPGLLYRNIMAVYQNIRWDYSTFLRYEDWLLLPGLISIFLTILQNIIKASLNRVKKKKAYLK